MPREITLYRGGVSINEDQADALVFQNLHGWIDEEGQFSIEDGEIGIIGLTPVDVDISINAEALPFRIPGQLDLSVNLDHGPDRR